MTLPDQPPPRRQKSASQTIIGVLAAVVAFVVAYYVAFHIGAWLGGPHR